MMELLDMVFSVDSVITAVGMSPYVSVLALSFLLMIGLVLVSEAFGAHLGKGYIYGAMGFSIFVELINIRTTRKTHPVALNQVPHTADITKQKEQLHGILRSSLRNHHRLHPRPTGSPAQ